MRLRCLFFATLVCVIGSILWQNPLRLHNPEHLQKPDAFEKAPSERSVPEFSLQAQQISAVVESQRVDTAAIEAKAQAQENPADSGAPRQVQELAVKLLGAADAKTFFATATSKTRSYKSRKFRLWHNKNDDLDFNPDPNYEFSKLKKFSDGSVAVDVGANLGDTAILAYVSNPQLRIVSFEPSPHNYIFMRWNLIANEIREVSEEEFTKGKPGVLALLGGATKDGRKIELAFAPEQTKHAQMKSDVTGFGYEIPTSIDGTHEVSAAVQKKYSGQWRTLEVPSFALPAWLKSHNAAKVKWFKLDCEGCEYETLIELVDGGFLKESIVVGEAHFRHIADQSCKQNVAKAGCKEMIYQMKHVRDLMCKKHKFSGCSKVMPCDIYQERCKQ